MAMRLIDLVEGGDIIRINTSIRGVLDEFRKRDVLPSDFLFLNSKTGRRWEICLLAEKWCHILELGIESRI